MKQPAALVLAAVMLAAFALAEWDGTEGQEPRPEAYRVVKAKKSGWIGRKRITLEIEADTAKTLQQQIETMMQAAADNFPKHSPKAMSVRLWKDYGSNPYAFALNRLVYAPDGCGWVGDKPCDKPAWTDAMFGEIPPELLDWNGP